jgi:hypothetical protein
MEIMVGWPEQGSQGGRARSLRGGFAGIGVTIQNLVQQNVTPVVHIVTHAFGQARAARRLRLWSVDI